MKISKPNSAVSEPRDDAPSHWALPSVEALGVPSWGVLILLATLPFAFDTGLRSFETLKELLLVAGMGVVLVSWGVAALRRGRFIVAPARVAILGAIFALYALVSIIWAEHRLWSLWEALHFVALAVALLITAAPSGRALGFGDIALASALGGLGAAVFGGLDLVGMGGFRPGWDPAGPTGAFDTPEFGAAYFVVILPIIWGGALCSRGVRRVFLALSFLISLAYFSLLAGWLWAGVLGGLGIVAAIFVGAFQRQQALRVLLPSVVLSALAGVFALVMTVALGAAPASSGQSGVTQLFSEYGVAGFSLFALWVLAIFAVAISGLISRGQAYALNEGRAEEGATYWLVEHWAMLSAGLAGVGFMLFTPLLSLAPAALSWVVILGVLARVSAKYNGFTGWSSARRAAAPEPGARASFGALRVFAGAAILVGLAILVPATLQTGASYYRGKGDRWLLSEGYHDAIDAYKSALRWYPVAGDIPFNIAQASAHIGDDREARAWVDRALKVRPDDIGALTLKGRLLLNDADISKAVGVGRRAVKAHPDNLEASNILLSALILEQRYEDAVAQAQKMLTHDLPPVENARLTSLLAELQKEVLRAETPEDSL
ncbi:tetratricopeptide repeat protein [Bradymonas sediminis]|nr:tetratricopeptide repeat protein [Bradymonas sediminis]TDP61774.1 tetratricopeptide repeat protein [Bradymonas sediminis]